MDHESNPWRENHGTAILLFAAALCVIGSLILVWKQSRPQTAITNPSNDSRVSLNESDQQAIAEGLAARGVRPIELRIFGAASDVGIMRIAIYTTPETFNKPEKAADLDNWQIESGMCTGTWEMPIEIKQCAIAAYHDENENGQLDLNPIGYPVERYGFSNNARGLVGPPTYEQAKITVSDEPIEISIR